MTRFDRPLYRLIDLRQSIDDTYSLWVAPYRPAPGHPRNTRGRIRAQSHEISRKPRIIFPIQDAPSASFMSFKASCLREAGIITESEKRWVDARVLSVLAEEMIVLAQADT